MAVNGWIGVDLDGTLALWNEEHCDVTKIGPPVPTMVARVKAWLMAGKDVRIFTARAHVGKDVAWITSAAAFGHTPETWITTQVELIEAWREKYLGQKLPITATKDFQMIELWDDRCEQVISNTGYTLMQAFTGNNIPREVLEKL